MSQFGADHGAKYGLNILGSIIFLVYYMMVNFNKGKRIKIIVVKVKQDVSQLLTVASYQAGLNYIHTGHC